MPQQQQTKRLTCHKTTTLTTELIGQKLLPDTRFELVTCGSLTVSNNFLVEISIYKLYQHLRNSYSSKYVFRAVLATLELQQNYTRTKGILIRNTIFLSWQVKNWPNSDF
jgi:hypothetical protein